MAQLDVFENSDEVTSQDIPYLLDVQHELHVSLKTRILIPLVRVEAQRTGITKLCPVFTIHGETVFASVPELASYPVAELGSKVGSLASERDVVFAAIDFLLNGF